MSTTLSPVSARRLDAPRSTGISKFFRRVIATPNDKTLTIARVSLGVMILPHGMQKLFGTFGGPGFSGTMGYMTDMLGVPAIFAFLAIVAEFFGGLGLIVGLLGRVAAVGVGSVMVVAALMSHVQHGFFMNWSGQAKGEGWEFHLLAAALAAVVAIRGSGAASVDRALTRDSAPQR